MRKGGLFLLTLLALPAAAQTGPKVEVSLTAQDQLTVGDRVEAVLTLRMDPSTLAGEPRFPVWGTSWGDAEVLAKGEAGLVPSGPLADGFFTLTEFKQTMYLTALATPTDDESDGDACLGLAGGFPGGENLPPAARFPIHGYGEINHASIDAAIAVLKGEAPMPERPDDDQAYLLAYQRKMVTVGDAE